MNGKMVNSLFLLKIQHIRCELVKFGIYVTEKRRDDLDFLKWFIAIFSFNLSVSYQNSIKKVIKTITVGILYIEKLEEFYINLFFLKFYSKKIEFL